MKTEQCNKLKTKTIEIHARAQGLQKQLPVHLKLMPEIKQTLALINDISEVLLCLAQMQPKGDSNHGDHR